MLRLTWLSPGALAFTTIQDLLSLDSWHRINVPGTPDGNWTWTLPDYSALTPQLADKLADLTALAGRDNFCHPNILTY
jgi:4-alpha-glucanotransferase